jgi:hypothetical protein
MLEFVLNFILYSCIYWVGFGMSSFLHKTRTVGYLRSNYSEDGDGPYLMLDLDIPVEDVLKCKKISLTVTNNPR